MSSWLKDYFLADVDCDYCTQDHSHHMDILYVYKTCNADSNIILDFKDIQSDI